MSKRTEDRLQRLEGGLGAGEDMIALDHFGKHLMTRNQLHEVLRIVASRGRHRPGNKPGKVSHLIHHHEGEA